MSTGQTRERAELWLTALATIHIRELVDHQLYKSSFHGTHTTTCSGRAIVPISKHKKDHERLNQLLRFIFCVHGKASWGWHLLPHRCVVVSPWKISFSRSLQNVRTPNHLSELLAWELSSRKRAKDMLLLRKLKGDSMNTGVSVT